jgi:hypothetical protein
LLIGAFDATGTAGGTYSGVQWSVTIRLTKLGDLVSRFAILEFFNPLDLSRQIIPISS